MKSKPVSIRYNVEDMAAVQRGEGLMTVQAVIDYLLSGYEKKTPDQIYSTPPAEGIAKIITKRPAEVKVTDLNIAAQKSNFTINTKLLQKRPDLMGRLERLPGESGLEYLTRTAK
jgi:hypothetical protein